MPRKPNKPADRTLKIETGGGVRAFLKVERLCLRVEKGPGAGRRVEVTDSLVVGRDEGCGCVLDDGSISGRHLQVDREADGLWVRDLESTNGTSVNGVRVERCRVAPGDRIQIGKVLLVVETESTPLLVTAGAETKLGDLVGTSEAMRLHFSLIRRLAPSELTVLVRGETGTGKELVAKTLHGLSPRHAGPFVTVDGTALSGPLAGSELFGHVKGAFTGAERDHKGAFERARGGTLFLDEVGELAPEVQGMLLRVLEGRTFLPVGAEAPRDADVRLVAATHRNLEEEVRQGRFRRDLYYRLAEVTLTLPALRERREDIPLLAEHLMGLLGPRVGRGKDVRLSQAAMAAVAAHDWPGNVRELRNYLAQVMALSGERIVHRKDLPPFPDLGTGGLGPVATTGRSPDGAVKALPDVERDLIRAALARHKGNVAAAARELGIAASTLRGRVKRLGLS